MVESIFLIFVGAAILASLALFSRQPLIVAYIVAGWLLGPYGLGWTPDADLISETGSIGIVFLLFLVGLDLPPAKLKNMLGPSIVTALVSSSIFFVAGFAVMALFGFSMIEAAITGIAAMFSSTIMGIKLLPTTALHHRHIGELVVSLLLIQDLIAIFALLALAALTSAEWSAMDFALVGASLPVIVAVAFIGARTLVLPLISRFDAFHEFIFLLVIGWCLGIAYLSTFLNLTAEIGAFVAGVSLAFSPIAQYVAETLRPLRDFFLILFFFSVGADVNPSVLADIIVPTLVLAVLLVAIKPVVFKWLLTSRSEDPKVSWEVGYRLGQASEFSLLVTYAGANLLTAASAHVIQGATVVTLIISTYLVIFRYPSPIAISSKLRRD